MISKKIFDLIIVVPGVLVLWPIFLVIGVWIKFDSRGPIFFRQGRVGKSGCLFKIFKFRTMVVNAESLGAKVTVGQDPRITRSGIFLRKYKLDELPQLINVLLGDMSLVGPRPEVPEFVKYWPEESRKLVLSVPPGITDFASIYFRDENAMLEGVKNPVEKYINDIIPIKLRYYTKYVDECSIFLDIKLIVKTIQVIFR